MIAATRVRQVPYMKLIFQRPLPPARRILRNKKNKNSIYRATRLIKKNIIFTFLLINIFTSMTVFCQYRKVQFSESYMELSLGLSPLHTHNHLYGRIYGTDSLMSQYAEYYQAGLSSSGELSPIKFMIPLDFSYNLEFTYSWFLKTGIEYASGSNSGTKTYDLSWAGTSENHQNDYKFNISYIMPYLGLEKGFSSFAAYLNLGLSFFHFSHQNKSKYTEDQYWHSISDTFTVNSAVPSMVVGIKYRINPGKPFLGKRVKITAKLEYILLRITNFTGKKTSTGESSTSMNFSETTKGQIYTYETNPFDLGWYSTWDLLTSPDIEGIRNLTDMILDLSCIRFSLGLSW